MPCLYLGQIVTVFLLNTAVLYVVFMNVFLCIYLKYILCPDLKQNPKAVKDKLQNNKNKVVITQQIETTN